MYHVRNMLAAGLVAAASATSAQTPLTALEIEARSYETTVSWQQRDWRPAGVAEYVHIPGHLILDLRLVFAGPWTDSLSRISVQARDIRVVLPDGTEIEPMGQMRLAGQMTLQARSLSGSRPRDFPNDPGNIHWNSVFRIPLGVETVTLRIGGDAPFTTEITVPPTQREEDASSFARFEPRQIRRFRTISLEDGRGTAQALSTISALPGHTLVSVDLSVTGLGPNTLDGRDRFVWHTHNFRLIDAEGRTMPLIGERFMQRLLDSQFNGVDIGRSSTRTVIWMVPEDLAEARLTFGETIVAEINLASAPITDRDR